MDDQDKMDYRIIKSMEEPMRSSIQADIHQHNMWVGNGAPFGWWPGSNSEVHYFFLDFFCHQMGELKLRPRGDFAPPMPSRDAPRAFPIPPPSEGIADLLMGLLS